MSKIDPNLVLSLVDEGEKKVINTSLDISLNELANMSQEGELIIDPDYQRLFQWDEGTRSRFIESLLLELPVPPIFAVEEESGRYQLVDGLQRISSYLHFRGQLSAPQFDPPVKIGDLLVLTECDIIPQLNGITYDDLPVSLQIRIRRSFLRLEIIRKSSDPLIKYHMFKRLNSEGKPLSDQQKRNSSLRMLDDKFIDFIAEMSTNEDFLQTIEPISEDKSLSWYDRELILRFFAMKNRKSEFKHDVRGFLNKYAEDIAVADAKNKLDDKILPIFDYSKEESEFKSTFRIINIALSDKAFGYITKKNSSPSSFSVLQFEAITLGIQPYLNILNSQSDEWIREQLGSLLLALKSTEAYTDLTSGGGRNSTGPFNNRVNYVTERIKEKVDLLS